MDIVIPLGTGCGWENHTELKYCLRSLITNMVDIDEIYIVGHKPDWLQGVVHIPFSDYLTKNKDGNLINKVRAACSTSTLSDNFLRLSDDQILLKSYKFDHRIAFSGGDLKTATEKELRGNRWRRRLGRTTQYLQENNLPTFCYDIHVPQVYNRYLFESTFSQIDYENDIGYTINTMYFNLNHEFYSRRNVQKEIKVELERRHSYSVKSIRSMCDRPEKLFLNYTDFGLTNELKQAIEIMFPNKSKFEK